MTELQTLAAKNQKVNYQHLNTYTAYTDPGIKIYSKSEYEAVTSESTTDKRNWIIFITFCVNWFIGWWYSIINNI